MRRGPDLDDVVVSTAAMGALFDGRARFQRMLDVEAALVQAAEAVGRAPPGTAARVGAACHVDRLDLDALVRDTALAATPVVPLVDALRALVAPGDAPFVHVGVTSQDVIDTAAMLQARDGLRVLAGDLVALADRCAGLALRHRSTPMAGRTLMQQAEVVTFGLTAAQWMATVDAGRTSVGDALERAPAVQLGGATGTQAGFGSDGPRLAERLGALLGLAVPAVPWHVDRSRVRLVVGALCSATAAAAKIAGDVLLLAQTEVGEVAEDVAPGKGRSSAMAHKRNPVDSILTVVAARHAAGLAVSLSPSASLEHQRAAGAWQLEWIVVPQLFCAVAAAVTRAGAVVDGLQVDEQRMAANIVEPAQAGRADAVAAAEAMVDRYLREHDTLDPGPTPGRAAAPAPGQRS